jgi:hypothetical protein
MVHYESDGDETGGRKEKYKAEVKRVEHVVIAFRCGRNNFPSSKPPYRFSKVFLFGFLLLIRLGLELGLRLGLWVRVGVGFGLVT